MADPDVPRDDMTLFGSRDPLDAALCGESDDPAIDALVHDLRAAYLPEGARPRSTALAAFAGTADGIATGTVGARPAAVEAVADRPVPVGRRIAVGVAAFAATVTGKVVLGGAVAAATLGGLHATEVVDVPMLPRAPHAHTEPTPVPDVVDVPDPAPAATGPPTQPEDDDSEVEETGDAPEVEETGDATELEETGDATELEETGDADVEETGDADVEETDGGAPDANADFGQSVAEDAQEGGVDGKAVATEARKGTPAEDRAAQPGAPETAGERQDGTVRQDDGAGEVEETEVEKTEDETDEPAPAAAANRPAKAGSQADNRPAKAGSRADTAGRP